MTQHVDGLIHILRMDSGLITWKGHWQGQARKGWKEVVVFSPSIPSDCDPTDCSPPGSSVLQARVLEWVAMPLSRGSSRPRDQTRVSCTAGGFFAPRPWGSLEGRVLELH